MVMMELELQYVKHQDVDKKRWDEALKRSSNALIYAETTFLDGVSPDWDAIVSKDYEFIMPLTWKKKWGISYLVQPPFSQQGGIFSRYPISKDVEQLFIKKAKAEFQFAEFTLNVNHENAAVSNATRTNYILSLKETYEEIQEKFSTSLRQILHSIKNQSLSYSIGSDVNEAIEQIRTTNGSKLKDISTQDFLRFEKLCLAYQQEDRLIIRKVFSNNQWLSTALLIKDDKRIYNLLSCITAEGRKSKANHFLYDRLIAEFAETGLILDFEGSDLPGVAFFYRSYNPESEIYAFVKWNDLPLPIRWLKR